MTILLIVGLIAGMLCWVAWKNQPRWDNRWHSTGYTSIYSAELNSLFDPGKGTFMFPKPVIMSKQVWESSLKPSPTAWPFCYNFDDAKVEEWEGGVRVTWNVPSILDDEPK